MTWRHEAACRTADPELFFPLSRGKLGETQAVQAKLICRKCPVVAECLIWAHETMDDWAVLGGTTPDERRRQRGEALGRTKHRVKIA